ncbi:hypothetical protein KIPB_014283, partial [Kipferlia bialata]|eukprot:g14283.t1
MALFTLTLILTAMEPVLENVVDPNIHGILS